MDHVDLPSLVSLAAGALDRVVRSALEEQGYGGLRTRHGYVFQRLLVAPQSITDLARTLEVSQQAMSKTVAELTDAGYVAVERDPADARRRQVRLTEHGRAAIACARRARARIEERAVAHTVPGEVAAAARVLTVLLAELGLGERVSDRTVPDPEAS